MRHQEERDMRLVIIAMFLYFAAVVLSACVSHTARAEAVVKKVIVKARTAVKDGQLCKETVERRFVQVPGESGGWVENRTEACEPLLAKPGKVFNRVANFPVCQQLDPSCNNDTETAAEIVAASEDGMTLVYTDSPSEQLGFVDIRRPSEPKAMGVLALGGEPTSVAVKGRYALVAVNTSENFVDVSGVLKVVDIAQRTVVHTLDLGGQPDSIAVSPDQRYAAVVIENERDEDLGDGAPPQLPAGGLVVLDLIGPPSRWTKREVDMTGLADLFPGDPEPEYVDINERNMAVVTMQENNHLALVDLRRGRVVRDFSAGEVDLEAIDTEEEEPALISLTGKLDGVRREPDGVAWLDSRHFATADEGDLEGGSRGFTVYNTRGKIVFSSGNALDHLAVRLGHYPDGRSGNKGNEPENIEFGRFGSDKLMFVASERSSLVFVYDAMRPEQPLYKQALPAGVGPEGLLAIPSRGLLIAASEEDNRGDKIRSILNIYEYGEAGAQYPTVMSDDRADGTPIPFGALSGLAADPMQASILYAVDDSFYQQSRIFKIDTSRKPARIVDEIFIENNGSRVNLDSEGVAVASDGGFWLVSEGRGTVGDDNRPVESLNQVFKLSPEGVVEHVFELPEDINAKQLRFGFEGVAESDGKVVVAFQRAWLGDANPRIGILDPSTGEWRFLFYPLDAVTSQNGGWVGLSDIEAIGKGQFLVLERDNQGGPDAAIKRIYQIDLSAHQDGVLLKTLVKDLFPTLAALGGPIPEKIEGLARSADGKLWINNDNDGVDDNSGENLLISLER